MAGRPASPNPQSGTAGRVVLGDPRSGRSRLLVSIVAVVAIVAAAWRIASVRITPAPTPRTPAQLILALERAAAADSRPREAYEGLGAACLRLGHFLSARAAFQRARALGADSPWLRQQFAWCALRLDRRAEALAEYRRLLEDEGHSASAYLRLAGAALRMGEKETARSTLRAMPVEARSHLLSEPTAPNPQRDRYIALLVDADLPADALAAATRILSASPKEGEARFGGAADSGGVERQRRGPGPGAALVVAARAAAKLGRWSDALHLTDAALRQVPARADLLALRGDVLTALGGASRRAAALQAYQQAVTLQPTLGPTYYRLAQLALAARRWEEAGRSFLAARSLGTEPTASLRGAARAAEAAGRSLVAAEHWGAYYEAVGETTSARRAYSRLLANSRTHLDGTLRLADLDARNQRLRHAIARLDAAARRYPTSPDLWRFRARAYRAYGRTHVAIAAWTRVIQLDPNGAAAAHRELAGIREGLGDFDDAERQYAEATRLLPEEATYHQLYGTLLLLRRRQGDRLGRAVVELERAVALAPDDAAPFVDLGHAYEAAGRQDEALIALRHAIDLAPGSGPPYLDLSRLARRLGRTGESREALAMYQLYRAAQREVESLKAIVAAHPLDPLVRLRLAAFYTRARDFGRAATEYERCLALEGPLSPAQRRDIHRRLAETYDRLARREDAAAQRALVEQEN